MYGCILKPRTDFVWRKHNTELAILNAIFSCTVSPEIVSLYQCVLFWKAYTLALKPVNGIISSIQSFVKAGAMIRPEFGQPGQMCSFPGRTGV